jgi:desulfoferrodoxin (superoxide reductase-like protein)
MRGVLIYGQGDFKHIPFILSNPKNRLRKIEVSSQEVMSQRNLRWITMAKVKKLVNRGNSKPNGKSKSTKKESGTWNGSRIFSKMSLVRPRWNTA